MCIPAAIFEYEYEMSHETKDETKKDKVKQSNYCHYSGLPSPLHYGSEELD